MALRMRSETLLEGAPRRHGSEGAFSVQPLDAGPSRAGNSLIYSPFGEIRLWMCLNPRLFNHWWDLEDKLHFALSEAI